MSEEQIKVTPSCGCIFCDLDLPIVYKDGVCGHEGPGRDQGEIIFVPCSDA